LGRSVRSLGLLIGFVCGALVAAFVAPPLGYSHAMLLPIALVIAIGVLDLWTPLTTHAEDR
jgi:uncharacterized membrane protein YoaK (UPF0700 family)